jgi:UDP-N-acetylglucosamine--N-acetylmuramyl-(pentapeptide) pyrophosphoryl-undecaprenol N-acetylglucosamine transferase
MRVYVAPCGIGLGHITRAAPIANELTRRGHTVVFSTYSEGLDYAKRSRLPTYEALPIGFKVTSDGTIDFKMTAATSGFSLGIRTFLRQLTLEMKYMKTFKPDVVFSDSRASSLLAARLIRIPVVLMLNQFRVEIMRRPSTRKLTVLDRLFFVIANIGWLFVRTGIEIVWGRSQVILIPDLPAPYTICIGNLAIPRRYNHKVKLIGPVLANRLHRITDQSRLKRQLGIDSQKPLIYAAVSGPKVERTILVRLLLESMRQIAREYYVVISCGDPRGSRMPRSTGGVRVYDWIEDQDDFIRASDLVISRAGHGTIMKSMAYGKPMILIPIPDHTEQYGNARRATALHIAEMMDQHRVNGRALEATIQRILESGQYHQNAVQIREQARSSNAIRLACDTILALTKGH